MKKILITGGSGFLGQVISRKLLDKGFYVVSIDLNPSPVDGVDFCNANFVKNPAFNEKLKNPLAVINLAGKNIFGKWDEKFKKGLWQTRVDLTNNLIETFKKEEFRPSILISASAVGFYGDRGNEDLDEKSEKGRGFLSDLCKAWEDSANQAKDLNVRVCIIRNALILGRGGLLNVLLPIYKNFLGGSLGTGKQWFPWIHIKDLADLYIKALEDENFPDLINGCASENIRNKDFSKKLAYKLSRPNFFRMPNFMLRLIYGEFAKEMTASQKIKPLKVFNIDYKFSFPEIDEALDDILNKNENKN